MSDTTVALKRSITLPLLFFYGVGTILGAGIYALAGKVAGESGVYTPHAFIFAAVVVSFSAHSYAQLAKHFPASAGEAVYVQEAFGRIWLATTIGWAIMFTGIVSAAAIANAFAAYLTPFLPFSDYPTIILLIIALSALAIWGVSQAVWFAGILTFIEIVGIGIIIFYGLPVVPDFISQHPQILAWPSASEFGAIGFGAFLAFYAFIGFEDIVNMAEEVKAPQRTVPRAVYLALIFTTVIYGLTALALMALLPLDQFIGSDAPFADVAREHGGISLPLITAISLAAITNGALVQIIMASRVIYGMAKRGLAPTALGNVWPRTKTPALATIVIGLLVLVFALLLPITSLARITSAVVLSIFTVINSALIAIYWQQRRDSRFLPVKMFVPALGVVVCLGFLLLQLWNP